MIERPDERRRPRIRLMVSVLITLSIYLTGRAAEKPRQNVTSLAHEIFAATGVQGGLVVHMGCGSGQLTLALHAGNQYLVHGLDVDASNVADARQRIASAGLYGPVSVGQFDGRHLPYADNLVNLLVAESLGSVPMSECLRVVAPRGVVYVREDGRWEKTVKPWPAEIDEWTHHLHGPGGNAVASDRVVGPPAHLQWTAGPLWARSHGWTPSVSAMVSAHGRVFYISDETLTGIDDTVPSQWYLVARDAFSGVRLWKRPVPHWGSDAFSGTPNTGQGVTVGRFTMPPNVGKRLVAVGDVVYVTLGATAPVTALDAATGEVKQVYEGTRNADEILCTGRHLIVSLNVSRGTEDTPPTKQICAIDTAAGRLLWKRGPFSAIRASVGQDPFGRLELAAGDGRVFAVTTKTVDCLDAESGQTLWQIDRPALPADAVRQVGFAGMFEYKLTVLVYEHGTVLLAQPEPNTRHTYHTMPGSLYAFDAADGHPLWKHAYGGWGHCTPPDVFVVNDVVWTHVNAKTEFGFVWGHGYKAKDPSIVDYRVQALDLRTGQLQKELSTRDIFNVGHHHRCYRNKITERFLMSCRRGVEFVDLTNGANYQDHWVRSGCLLGYLPCNGLLYVTPHPCQCYINAKLTGFNALAPATVSPAPNLSRANDQRLVRGPAYGSTRPHEPTVTDAATDWPTYRHDGQRSGATDCQVGSTLKVAWKAKVGGVLTGLTVAGGQVFVADKDAHTVRALNVSDGRETWEFTVGARVDSPPTYYRGTVIFGSADGKVYTLRAADGQLVWKFDAAPGERYVTAFGQLESPWPVPGSVLVDGGKCWFAAGRSSYLDGGIRVYTLDPGTGTVLDSHTVYSPDPKTGKMAPDPSAQTVAGLLNDIPASDGTNVFIRQMPIGTSSGLDKPHLYTTAGFLDSSWFNRTFWQAGRARTTGLMVLGSDVAYGAEVYPERGREAVFQPGGKSYRVMCLPLNPSSRAAASKGPGKKTPRQPKRKPQWERYVALRTTAMVRAADKLFIAGPPDIVDKDDPNAAWEGRRGGVLVALAENDGRQLAEYPLPAPPVWDGMAVTPGHLFVSTTDGQVVCLKAH